MLLFFSKTKIDLIEIHTQLTMKLKSNRFMLLIVINSMFYKCNDTHLIKMSKSRRQRVTLVYIPHK